MSNIKKSKKEDKDKPKSTTSTFVFIIVVLITVTMGFGSARAISGIRKVAHLKQKRKNPDGTYSIWEDAQTRENQNKPGTYVGKVLDYKITIGNNNFTRQIQYLQADKTMSGYQKYSRAKAIFDWTINKKIGVHNGKKMGITIPNDYLYNEVGKRTPQYHDEDGDVNLKAMSEDPAGVSQRAKVIKEDLLYEQFTKDYFKNFPVDIFEVWADKELKETSVVVDFVYLSNESVDKTQLRKYFNKIKDDYKKYKLVRLVFDKDKMTEAQDTLAKIKESPDKFFDIANKLRDQNKLKIVYDSEYTLNNHFDNLDLSSAVAKTPKNGIGDTVIITDVGVIVFKVADIQEGSLEDETIYEEVNKKYLNENYESVANANKNKIEAFYKYAQTHSFKSAAAQYGLEVKTSSPIMFLEDAMDFNFVSADNSADVNFYVSIFKAKEGETLVPYEYDFKPTGSKAYYNIQPDSGFLVVKINKINKADQQEFLSDYETSLKKASDEIAINLEIDFYAAERKKYTIIDNFEYCFNINDFETQKTQQ